MLKRRDFKHVVLLEDPDCFKEMTIYTMQAAFGEAMQKRRVEALNWQRVKFEEKMESIRVFEAVLEEGFIDAEAHMCSFMEEWSKLDVRSTALCRANKSLRNQNKRIRNRLASSGCKLPLIDQGPKKQN